MQWVCAKTHKIGCVAIHRFGACSEVCVGEDEGDYKCEGEGGKCGDVKALKELLSTSCCHLLLVLFRP